MNLEIWMYFVSNLGKKDRFFYPWVSGEEAKAQMDCASVYGYKAIQWRKQPASVNLVSFSIFQQHILSSR